ncbi:hypothetical protein [Thermomonas sp.]|jgi:hypothetical protein|uniref:hypothetical protein n=1 Tax=Thermomonas sp. TaxID=1971895 RepID=UPI001AC15753|nr:hypothetical protein [Xanthomonadales bacterium]
MSLRLYAGDRVWLIVPDCMLASQAAIDRYGPLAFVGEVDEMCLSDTELAKIMAGFDVDLFAKISKKAAKLLLAGSGA